jgi:FMN phosphatase YigB (HAD superfamily)
MQVVGKPQATFFALALSDLGVPPSATVMVGDDVRDDVGGAMACGMAGILGMRLVAITARPGMTRLRGCDSLDSV